MAQWVKNLPAMPETQDMWVQLLGQEDPLKEKNGTTSSLLARKIHGQRSLVGYSPGGQKKSDLTEPTHTQT